jgi:creatinine amidohydrolase
MSDTPWLLHQLGYRDLKTASYELAVLPWGATEPHNLHLPYGTDTIETDRIAAASAEYAWQRGARPIVLPTIPFGVNTGQMDIPLTINMNPSTQMMVLEDVLSSIECHGIQRLVILNGHGGNDFRQMIRELQPRHTAFLCVVNWYRSVPLKDFFDVPGDHADEMETSLMLHIAPETVLPLTEAGQGKTRKSKIAAFREGWAWTPRQWTRVTDDTGAGDPRAATAQKGSAYLAAVTAAIGTFFVDIARADTSDLYEHG